MYQSFIKRGLDILFSIILIPFAVIICLPFAIIIKATDRGTVFYNAERLGKLMVPFKMYKLRSMKADAPDIRNEDGSTFNSAEDPRVTRIGKVIRKTSVDELPQLLNVFLGQMSFVGPRPSPLGNESRYSEDFKERFAIKPGITGLTQSVLRNSATLAERTRYDVYYTKNISFKLDFKIIVMTIANVISKKNINRNEANE